MEPYLTVLRRGAVPVFGQARMVLQVIPPTPTRRPSRPPPTDIGAASGPSLSRPFFKAFLKALFYLLAVVDGLQIIAKAMVDSDS